MNGSNHGDGAAWALLGIGFLPFFVLLFVWLISAVVAAIIADHRGRSGGGFFFATFFFLGPLGPGFALLAAREVNGVPVERLPRLQAPPPEKRSVADGRRRFTCPRCGAENDIPDADTSYDCWRCEEHRAVKAKAKTTG
jgi:DNA-directed RNA polymerase subunit RPC12/RpoP